MRIAFDLDGTLIPTSNSFASGSQKLGFPVNVMFKDELRCGARS
jgi:hypothetical protein